jgi:hypothetical protein
MSLVIISAWYGGQDRVSGLDVLSVVKAAHESGVATLSVTNEVFTDPFYGNFKVCDVTYTFNGETKSVSVLENEVLVFAELV